MPIMIISYTIIFNCIGDTMKTSCEVCQEITHCDRHHIESQAFKGSNKKFNVTKLCPNCHRLVHMGEIILEGKFLTSIGYQLIWHRASDTSILNQDLPNVFTFKQKSRIK